MCTFEELLQNEGKRKWIAVGKKEGREEGRIEGKDEGKLEVYANLKNRDFDDQTMCSMLGITLQKLQQFKKRLSEEALIPKIV